MLRRAIKKLFTLKELLRGKKKQKGSWVEQRWERSAPDPIYG